MNTPPTFLGVLTEQAVMNQKDMINGKYFK